MYDRLSELSSLFRDMASSRGFSIALSAFAGGVARMIMKAHHDKSGLSFWSIVGGLFVAICVGFLVGNLIWYYTGGKVELTAGAAFSAAFLAKKILDWLDKMEISDLINHLKGKKQK